ncbi:hypothetical protein Salat_2500500 [Sesamum alatum]|uniref:Uncharacterized protein n=1 Tax=Sesamum alatum TaxID=300844 RepID=A0AAE2CCA0_9LAMI|nr:hypothetical protein Salat_2500500 [Sesamum alatum]
MLGFVNSYCLWEGVECRTALATFCDGNVACGPLAFEVRITGHARNWWMVAIQLRSHRCPDGENGGPFMGNNKIQIVFGIRGCFLGYGFRDEVPLESGVTGCLKSWRQSTFNFAWKFHFRIEEVHELEWYFEIVVEIASARRLCSSTHHREGPRRGGYGANGGGNC